jgi:hypothetical protein
VTNEEAIATLQRHVGTFRGSQLAAAIEHAIEILTSLRFPTLREQHEQYAALRDSVDGTFSKQYAAVVLRTDVDGTFVPPGHVLDLGSPTDALALLRRVRG